VESTTRVNILMVDDQPAKLLSYEAILSDLDANLIKARSGREGLELLLKHDVAVVLLDVSMPEINGFEMADMIRQHPRFQKTAILFISAVRMTDLDRIKGYKSGAVDYISVPVVPEILRAKVSIFAELHRKTRELQQLNHELEKRVEERTHQLKESERQIRQLNSQLELRVVELETIMQVLPMGVAVAHDPDCSTVTANQAFSDLIGVQPGENISKNADCSGAETYDVFRDGRIIPLEEQPIQRSIATGRTVASSEMEIRRHADGRAIQVMGSASPLFDASGKVRGAVGAFFDVTERKKMEDLLRERADLLDLASEAIFVRDMKGILRFWNSGAEALYGWSRDEVLGKCVHQFLQTKFPVDLAIIEQALMTEGHWEGNLVHTTRDGREVVVASRHALADGAPAILEINRDITAQLRAEDALRKTEKLAAMGRLAGIIAHEINNPLESITNAFYLLRNHPSLDEEARYFAQLGEEELARVCHITKQTLGFYRESQHPVDVSISALLDEVLNLQARKLQLERIVLEKKYLTAGAIRGFPVELRQVFFNLIGNAIEAMPDGGKLRIHLGDRWNERLHRTELHISVCDTGLGVRPKHGERLFEPFFSTKSLKGTGLGLWISKGIVEKHEGTIRFRSLPLKGGNVTVFRVVLPGFGSQANVSSGGNHVAEQPAMRESLEGA
jgi:PAS domain S-box-containing protein